MLDGVGRSAADAAHARLVFAPGQSFDLGRKPLYLDLIEQARKHTTWCPKGREAVSATDLFRAYQKAAGCNVLGAANNMQVADWWDDYGRTGMEELAKMRMQRNSTIPAFAGPERNWSRYEGECSSINSVVIYILAACSRRLYVGCTVVQFFFPYGKV